MGGKKSGSSWLTAVKRAFRSPNKKNNLDHNNNHDHIDDEDDKVFFFFLFSFINKSFITNSLTN